MTHRPDTTHTRPSHIRNVYMTAVHVSPQIVERVLVIETDLNLPQSRFAPRDPRIEDLLLELNELKTRNPSIFRAVDTVEIRDAQNNMNNEAEECDKTHDGFTPVTGVRVSPARAAHLPAI